MRWKSLWRLQTVVLAGGLALFAVRPATAQTAENTVITNTATVNWTDANSNSYTPVNGSVNVTVGFQAGIDAIATAALERREKVLLRDRTHGTTRCHMAGEPKLKLAPDASIVS